MLLFAFSFGYLIRDLILLHQIRAQTKKIKSIGFIQSISSLLPTADFVSLEIP